MQIRPFCTQPEYQISTRFTAWAVSRFQHTTCSPIPGRATHGHGAFPAWDPTMPSTSVGFARCKSRLLLLLYLQHQPIRWDGQGLLPWEHSATKLGGAEEIRMRRGTWEAHGELCSVSWLWMKVLEHHSTGRGQEESPGLGNSHGAETLEEKGIGRGERHISAPPAITRARKPHSPVPSGAARDPSRGNSLLSGSRRTDPAAAGRGFPVSSNPAA